MADRERILKRLKWASLILSVALVATLLPLRALCFAAEIYFTEAEERAVVYGIQVGEMLADLVIVEGISLEATGLNSRAKGMAGWKHKAYGEDHRTAMSGRSYVENLSGQAYAEKFMGSGGNTPGYRTIAAGGPTHAELYDERVATWKERMEEMLSGNNYALNDIILCQPRIGEILGYARTVAGYTMRAEEAAFLEVLLDDEMSKLNTDVDRRLALETEIALNEQLERSDALAAYSLALGSWRSPGDGGGY